MLTSIKQKIDFKVILTATNANPNGDPLNGNRPRQNFEGYGEITDVSLKRKIRNRLQDMDERIFVQSNDRVDDGCKSLKERADNVAELAEIEKSKTKDADLYAYKAAETWIDVRSFGQVFAFKGSELSVGVRGPVSIRMAVSEHPITVNSMQITKSVNSVTSDKKGSDTMGMKHSVDFGLYTFSGSINIQLAEKTGFTEADAEKIKNALITLFENDSSSARPEGTMEVKNVYWWKHPSKLGKYSAAKVHRSVQVEALTDNPRKFEDFKITVTPLKDIDLDVIDGI